MLSLEVEVWATVFGFPLATPFQFFRFPFPIAVKSDGIVTDAKATAPLHYPNPSNGQFTLTGAQGSRLPCASLDGQQYPDMDRSNFSLNRCLWIDGCLGVLSWSSLAKGRREVLRVSFVR